MMMTIALLLSLACGPSTPPLTPAQLQESSRVLVVINESSPESVEIGNYYSDKRKVPKENIVKIQTGTSNNISIPEYGAQIEKPIREGIDKCGHHIDFIVLTKGVPIRLQDDGGCSVDAVLAGFRLPFGTMEKPSQEAIKKVVSPYFGKDEPFDSDKFKGLYLVTRLDGPSVADAKRLVDNSLNAKPDKGPFFFDQAGNRNDSGYGALNKTLSAASEGLSKKGFQSALETTDAFVAPPEPLMGYCSWGSNDARFDPDTYHKLKFKPGAIAETFVSTSGRSFAKLKDGQSQVTDLIGQGVTGVKGYVSEPFTFALARPEILFDRYTKGYNLAESFYMASLVLKWKDVVIGDPLCRPYKH